MEHVARAIKRKGDQRCRSPFLSEGDGRLRGQAPVFGSRHAAHCGRVMAGIQFDADEATAKFFAGNQRGSETAEWIEDIVARFSERLDQRRENRDRLLCGRSRFGS